MEHLQQYVFHYNPFTDTWNAIPRDKYVEYWTNPNAKGVIKSSNIKTLIELLNKGEDFIEKIK